MMSLPSGLITAMALASLALPAMSRAASIELLMELSPEELTKVIVTSSTLTEETLKTVPSSMTVYTRKDIRRLGLQTLPQLINLVPGYQSYRSDLSGLNQVISSRGRRLGTTGREILILMDGQRLNDDDTGGTGQFDTLISLENVARVEFIHGPGSAIYGSNAMMGVINIITHSERELNLEAGNQQRRHGGVQWHQEGKAGKLDVFARSSHSAGEEVNVFEPSPSPLTPITIDTHDPYTAEDIYLRAELGEFSLAARASNRDVQQFYMSGAVDNAATFFDTRTSFINLGWQHPQAESLLLTGRLFASQKKMQFGLNVTWVPYLIGTGVNAERETGTEWILQDKQGSLRWLLGWEWRNPELTDSSFQYGPASNTQQFHVTTRAANDGRYINGLFGQLQWLIVDSLELTVGLRHDNYSDFGSHFSPRVGLVQQLGESDSLKLHYSEAFRAPSRTETSITSAILQAAPDLLPETAKTTELVWVHTSPRGYLSTTLFDTVVKDAIVETVTPAFARSWANSQQTVSGVEVEWLNHWNHAWQSRIALTHIFDPIGDIHTESSNLLSGSLSYEHLNWTASLLANYQGEKVDPNEQVAPTTTTETTRFGGRSVFGAHLAYHAVPELELYFHADNLFDKNYLSPAASPRNYVGVPGTGRTLTAGLRWSFD